MLGGLVKPTTRIGPLVIEIYTDGACRGNPGPGGWAALLRRGTDEKEILGAEAHTTNNRMELHRRHPRARGAASRPVQARIYTDSQYVRQGITEWLAGWKARGWRTADKKPVKNQDLWEQLDALSRRIASSGTGCRATRVSPGNERVDQLANEAIDAFEPLALR